MMGQQVAEKTCLMVTDTRKQRAAVQCMVRCLFSPRLAKKIKRKLEFLPQQRTPAFSCALHLPNGNEPGLRAAFAIGASLMHEDLQHGIVVLLNKFHPKPDTAKRILSIGALFRSGQPR